LRGASGSRRDAEIPVMPQFSVMKPKGRPVNFLLRKGNHAMRRALLAATALATTAVCTAPALAAPPDSRSGAMSILFENDIFFDTDRHYTNGVALDYTTAPQDT